MEYASEMIIRAAQCGDRIAEMPTGLRRPPGGRASKLRPVRDGIRHLSVILGSSSRRETTPPAPRLGRRRSDP
jgi:hypothetical protein